MHMDRDYSPCNDHNRTTSNDMCYRGACGSWVDVPTVIQNEADRQSWIHHEQFVDTGGCTECNPVNNPASFPMYLALDATQNGGPQGHGAGSVQAAVYSYMRWRYPDTHFTDWRIPVLPDGHTADPSANLGDLRGRALIISKFGSCAGGDQWQDAGAGGVQRPPGCSGADNHLQIRSENQIPLNGYNRMQVFIPTHETTVSNVQAPHSPTPAGYVPGAIHVNQPIYTDQPYAFTDLPNFLLGLSGIKTPNADIHSDPSDLQWLCFDIDHKSNIYVLFSQTARDRPTWLKSTFTNLGVAAVDDNTGMGTGSGTQDGSLEVWYRVADPGNVCLGGNDAPGVTGNYIVMAGPVTDLTRFPSHAVHITGLTTHSHEPQGSVPGTDCNQGEIGCGVNGADIQVGLGVGDPYYTDRGYEFRTLPPFLQHLEAIRTANDDKDADALDDQFICFRAEEPMRVYVLFDHRISAHHAPAWLVENFVDRHEEIAQSGNGQLLPAGHQSAADGNMGYFEIWSGVFPPGRVCTGGAGCNGTAGLRSCSNYMIFVGPDDIEPFVPGSASASPRYFDGNSDYAVLPTLNGGRTDGAFDIITIDTWVKFYFAGGGGIEGNHPIMNEDGWRRGDMHYQIYNGQFGVDVNGAGDQTFTFGANANAVGNYNMQSNHWYYISMTYSTVANPAIAGLTGPHITMYVGGTRIFPARTGSPNSLDGLNNDLCPACTVPISLDSPRLGAWKNNGNNVVRSMHGEMSAFRVWNIARDGQDICPSAQTPGLIAQYIFGPGDDTLQDLSGNENDGTIHDAVWTNDLPASQQCQKQGFGGYFDGDSDYAVVPHDLGTFNETTMDVWVKFDEINGSHPIAVEDGWNPGTIHLQILNGNFLLGVWGLGNYKFDWQPTAGEWNLISLMYGAGSVHRSPHFNGVNIELHVNGVFRGNNMRNGAFISTPRSANNGMWNSGNPMTCSRAHPCQLPLANVRPAHFHQLRLGAWSRRGNAGAGNMDRSLRGSIASFRLWDKMKGGSQICPPSGASGLIVNYMFDSFAVNTQNFTIMKDRSGNGNDGQLHDTKYSADYPDISCLFTSGQLYRTVDPVIMGESGRVTVGCSDCNLGGTVNCGNRPHCGIQQLPVTVNLTQTYTNPVVIVGVPTENGHDSAVVRVQNLRPYGQYAPAGINSGSTQYNPGTGNMCTSSWCFELFLQEPDCLDQWHVNEDVSWMVMEEGSYVANERAQFQAGTATAQGGNWEQITFHNSFPRVTPVVLSHVQTTHDPHFVKTRQQNANRNGFSVRLEQIGSVDGAHIHGTETIGWVAFQGSHGHIGQIQFQAGNTAEEVTERPEVIHFRHAFDQIPKFFGTIATTNGHDAAQLRRAGVSPSTGTTGSVTRSQATVYIEEEECVDNEGNGTGSVNGGHGGNCAAGMGQEFIDGNGCHPAREVVSWLALSPATTCAIATGCGQDPDWGADSWTGYQTITSSNDGRSLVARHKLAAPRRIGETGHSTVNTNWLTVRLHGTYQHPMVFCSSATRRGADAVTCRIRRVRFSPTVPVVDAHGHVASNACPGGGWCFDIALQETSCSDHWHIDEEVDWLVLEQGIFTTDTGDPVQVGKAQVAGGGWTMVNYLGTGFTSTPAVITQIQSFHGQYCYNPRSGSANFNASVHCHADAASGSGYCADGITGPQCAAAGQIRPDTYGFLKTRIRKPSMTTGDGSDPYDTRPNHDAGVGGNYGSGAGSESWRLRADTQRFYASLESDQTHGLVSHQESHEETVGWVAFGTVLTGQAVHGSMGGLKYEAGSTPLSVTDQDYPVVFSGFFRAAPKFFGQIASYHGTDSAELRLQSTTPSAATIMIEEEACHSTTAGQQPHPMAEQIDYLALQGGMGSDSGRDSSGILAHTVAHSTSGTSNLRPFGESGDIMLRHEWVTVSLKNYYFKPVIIGGAPTTRGGDPSVIRIRNIRHGRGSNCSGWCFDIKLQEPACLDGTHTYEQVHWLAIEAGSWSSDEGAMVQAGTLEVEGDMRTTGMQFTPVEFLQGGFPGVIPAVLTQCMSYYGSDWVKTRQQQGDSTHFMVTLEEQGGLAGHGASQGQSSLAHTNWEEVGWVAFEPASGNLGARDYIAGLTPLAVTHQNYRIQFSQEFTDEPRVFATMQTYLGTDSAEVRQRSSPTTRSATIFVEEETCSDTETNHVAEVVGYLALQPGSGLLFGQSNLNLGCENIYDATTAILQGGARFSPESGRGSHCAQNDAACLQAARANGTIGTGVIDFTTTGAAGTGTGESASWDLHRCRAAHAFIIFGYALGGSGMDRPMAVDVNGHTVEYYLSMPATGSWHTFSEVRIPVRLNAGRNRITLRTIGFSGPNVDYLAISSIGGAGYGESNTVGEAGVIHTIDYSQTAHRDPEEQWQTVQLTGSYTDPVVVIGVPTELGGQEAVARVRGLRYSGVNDGDSCDGHCFEVRLQEPACLDDLHVSEELPWMVMEQGTWFTDGGKMIQAGRVNAQGATVGNGCCSTGDTSCCTGSTGCSGPSDNAQCGMASYGGFVPVAFHSAFPDTRTSILPQVQTYNDQTYAKARLGTARDANGFSVLLESADTGSTVGHGMESIGWIAFQHASDSLGGDMYMADTTGPTVSSVVTSGEINFCSGFFSAPPLFFASIATFNGHDSAALRLNNRTSSTMATVYVEEETCTDTEQVHVPEDVNFLAIEWPRGHKIRATNRAPPRGGAATAGGSGLTPGASTTCSDPTTTSSCTTTACWQAADQNYCAASVTGTMTQINDLCCRHHGDCQNGFPIACSNACAGLWMPIWEVCDDYLLGLFPTQQSQLTSFSDQCDAQLYGTGATSTCTAGYYQQGVVRMGTACAGAAGGACSATCRGFLEAFLPACFRQISADTATAQQVQTLQAACLPGGGAH
jgi:hypothetical protein